MKNSFFTPFFADPNHDSESSSLKSSDDEMWLVYSTLAVIIAYFFSIVYIYFSVSLSAEYNISPFLRLLNSAASTHLMMLGSIIFTYWYFVADRKNWQEDFFLRAWKPLYIVEAIGLEMGLFIPLAILAVCSLKILEFLKKILGPDLAKYLDTTPHFKEYLLKLDWDGFALVAVIAVIIAPTIEELVFRRVIFGCLSQKIGMVAAVIVTSALFAGIHFRIVDFPTLFILGIIWQLQFIYHKSIYPSILYHTFHNSVAMGLLFIIKFFNIPIA